MRALQPAEEKNNWFHPTFAVFFRFLSDESKISGECYEMRETDIKFASGSRNFIEISIPSNIPAIFFII
jgi:hypothetical protein